MPAEETVAASSPADVNRMETVADYDRYIEGLKNPEPPAEEAESAPADAPEETAETDAPESEPEEDQEQPPKASEAQKRIKQLLAKVKELESRQAPKQDAPAESSPAQPQHAFPKPKSDDKNADGTPKYAEYEDFTEALGRWAAKEERATWEREQAEQQALNALQTTLEEARSRYEDADEVIFPAAQAIREAKIPLAVKEVFAGSEHFIDLCYVVGSDPDELNKFISLAQKNPRAAIGKVFEYERGIREEQKPRDDKGKFAAPEPKTTKAPKPPSPVGGGSSRTFDVNDESLSPEEWMRQMNLRDQKRKG